MVATYSLTSTYRSGSRPSSVLAQVTKGGKSALAFLQGISTPHSESQTSVATSSFTPDVQTLAQLKALPDNSFGRQWLALIQKEGQDHDFCTNGLHVLTGYETDSIGRAELQAFLFGATGYVTSLFQCLETVNTLQQGLSHPSPLGSRLYRAYQRGRTSYFDMDTWHPEQLWDLPVQYVRQWFGLS